MATKDKFTSSSSSSSSSIISLFSSTGSLCFFDASIMPIFFTSASKLISLSASEGITGSLAPPLIRVYVVSKSIISLNNIVPSSTLSLHLRNALIAKGDSYNPPIINSRPASILFAIEISPSLDKSSTDPISFRYILTGSSERAPSSSDKFPAFLSSTSSDAASSCWSTIFMPMSLIAE